MRENRKRDKGNKGKGTRGKRVIREEKKKREKRIDHTKHLLLHCFVTLYHFLSTKFRKKCIKGKKGKDKKGNMEK
jgi:hypothetical protein